MSCPSQRRARPPKVRGGEPSEPVPTSCRFAMEPFCPLLLAGVSLPLAKALKGNETTSAVSNQTSTTSGEDPVSCPCPALAVRPSRWALRTGMTRLRENTPRVADFLSEQSIEHVTPINTCWPDKPVVGSVSRMKLSIWTASNTTLCRELGQLRWEAGEQGLIIPHPHPGGEPIQTTLKEH